MAPWTGNQQKTQQRNVNPVASVSTRPNSGPGATSNAMLAVDAAEYDENNTMNMVLQDEQPPTSVPPR